MRLLRCMRRGCRGWLGGLALGAGPVRVNLVSPGATMTEMVSLFLVFGLLDFGCCLEVVLFGWKLRLILEC